MRNPEYFRLNKDRQFVGFKRVITEYLPAGKDKWQLDPIEHEPKETEKLSRPAVGIGNMQRASITSRD